MVRPQRRGHFYLVTGLVIGLICGILYGWVFNPTRYYDVTPRSLHADFQKQYILLIAQSYQATEDIGRSYSRIRQLSDPVDMDALRTILLEMESNPEYEPYFDTVRILINDLDLYQRTGPVSNNPGTGVVQPFAGDAFTPTVPVAAADPNQSKDEAELAVPNSQQTDGFFVVSNP